MVITMLVSDFFNSFHHFLYKMSPDDARMDINKYERVVKSALFSVIGGKREVLTAQGVKVQESFHTRIDQLAQDYRTWQKGGYKRYAKPKQYITGQVAQSAKRAFDQTLHNLIREEKTNPTPATKRNFILQRERLLSERGEELTRQIKAQKEAEEQAAFGLPQEVNLDKVVKQPKYEPKLDLKEIPALKKEADAPKSAKN
ncbi:MAG: hypothetical protein S4CHLAM102_14100 [Chlamydiia bacterium]|nr:hypothetical protein [Chlamydiia bacterium]